MQRMLGFVATSVAVLLLGVVGACFSPHLRSKEENSRVIVQLKVDSKSDEAAERRKAIAHAREALLRELSPESYRVTRAYETIQFVGLEVTPEGLRVLRKSPLVLGVQEDTLGSPHEVPK